METELIAEGQEAIEEVIQQEDKECKGAAVVGNQETTKMMTENTTDLQEEVDHIEDQEVVDTTIMRHLMRKIMPLMKKKSIRLEPEATVEDVVNQAEDMVAEEEEVVPEITISQESNSTKIPQIARVGSPKLKLTSWTTMPRSTRLDLKA